MHGENGTGCDAFRMQNKLVVHDKDNPQAWIISDTTWQNLLDNE